MVSGNSESRQMLGSVAYSHCPIYLVAVVVCISILAWQEDPRPLFYLQGRWRMESFYLRHYGRGRSWCFGASVAALVNGSNELLLLWLFRLRLVMGLVIFSLISRGEEGGEEGVRWVL